MGFFIWRNSRNFFLKVLFITLIKQDHTKIKKKKTLALGLIGRGLCFVKIYLKKTGATNVCDLAR